MRITTIDLRQAIALEARSDYRDLDAILHLFVEDQAEVDLHVVVLCRLANQVASFVHFVNAELAGRRDVDQNAACAEYSAFFHQGAVDSALGGFEGSFFAEQSRFPSWRSPCPTCWSGYLKNRDL